MKKILLSLILVFSTAAFSQDFSIRGKVVDALSKLPLEASTIYAESIKDSSLVSYTITNEKGVFDLEGKTKLSELKVFITFNGYEPLVVNVKPKEVLELGELHLQEQAQELDGVQLVADRVPISIKKDTLEFNADSFKTRPDASVEDVLKKLPGVDVASDGKITVYGKEVNQVLVNGQVFFSNDPKVATKSLPKDIISKIQITDTKTKKQEFTGEDSDGETKTINLTIKKDKNKGVMGRVAAAYGTDDRYQLNGVLNYFNDKERVSVITGSNNINSSGFSYDELEGLGGNSRRYNMAGSPGSGNGITTSSSIGGSYANSEKGTYKADGNYLFSYEDSYNNQKTFRENLLPENRYFSESETSFNGSTNSNRGGASLEYDIDETFRVSVQPKLNVNRTNSYYTSKETSRNQAGDLINSNEQATTSDGVVRNYSNRINLMKKLDTLGRFVTLSFFNRNTENTNLSNLNSIRSLFGDEENEETLDQRAHVNNKGNAYQLEGGYRQPLTKELFLDLGYEYADERSDNTKEVFDYNEDDFGYTNFNMELSSDFNFKNIQHSPSLGIRKNGEKFSFDIYATYKFSELSNQDYLQQTSFSNAYTNLLFRSSARYMLGKNKRIHLRYNSNLSLPSINQLQPVPNVSNPLNIVIGNPNLLPSVNHGVNFYYSDYNWKERSGVYVYSGLNIQDDRVSSISVIDENFLRTTRYTNVNGNYNGYMGMGYSKQIKKDSVYTLKFNVRPSINFGQSVSYSNGAKIKAKSFGMYPRVSTTFNYKELIEIEPGYGLAIDQTKYSLEGYEDVKVTAQNASLKLSSYWPKNIIWENDITYSYNDNVGPGFKKDAIFWNMSLGLQVMDKKGTLKLLAYDLLDQNINTRRSTGDDYIQDFQGTVLQQYFMASFSYKFDQFGGKRSMGRMR
ncbi:CarboxypepD_reg-like domain-containing protein [Arenibacter nanhaiticus]|uniref:CarboxypepD_reg-like domain-containing protein n=1 Tax=Arenibacter nanhaiticus TaxID=558155 RepID=A0A1M6FE59_9FLAO|nr:outer membrane beta-barrel protein [Arenibacter nanhaiticus]SHI95971.1 CarboxypepD_reg-like domain-containing protein [Arenibacter nanhaiticus]